MSALIQGAEELLYGAGFAHAERCASCRRTVSAISDIAKCAYCCRPIPPGEDGLKIDGDIFHAGTVTGFCRREARDSSPSLA